MASVAPLTTASTVTSVNRFASARAESTGDSVFTVPVSPICALVNANALSLGNPLLSGYILNEIGSYTGIGGRPAAG